MSDGKRTLRVRRLRLAAGSAAVLAAAAAVVGSGAIGDSTASASPQRSTAGNTLVIGVSSDPQTLDPEYGQATRANELIKNIYSQWVRYAPVKTTGGDLKANLKNAVGEALQSYTQSPDGTVTMTLRPGIKSAAGNPITADDLVYKIQRSLGLNAGSVFDFNILGLTKPDQVTKVNDTTIQIKLPTASPILGPMLRDQDAGLVDSTVLKAHATTADPWAHDWLAQNGTATTGAYQITQNVPGQKIVLTANPNYWGPAPYFQTVVLQVIPSAQTRILLLENGSIDIAEDLSLNDALRLKGKSGVKLVTAPTVNQDLLGFVQDKKPFNNPLVRKAIAYAVPYQQLVTGVLKGQAKVAKGVWPQNSIWFKKAPWPYKLDPAKAKALLKQAGYAKGLTFTVEVSTGDADAQALAVPLQTALKNVGVTMNIKALSAAQFQGDLGKRSMSAWIQSNLGSYVDDPYYQTFLWYGTKSVINWFKLSNPVIDAATKQFATVLTPAKKSSLALAVQQQLNKNVPLISLGEPNFVLAMRSDISGFLYEPDGLLTYRLFTRK